MIRKIIVLPLVGLILLAQFTFAPLHAQETFSPAQNEIISFFNNPQMFVIADIKRILNETAPELLNNDPNSIQKLKAVIKLIEDDAGFDPYSINQIALSLNLNQKSPENPLVVIKTESSADVIAEKFYQNKVAQAKFAIEKNPLEKRILDLKYNLNNASADEIPITAITQNKEKFSMLSAQVKEVQSKLANIKTAKANEILMSKLKKNSETISSNLGKISAIWETNLDTSDSFASIETLEKNLRNISLNDPQRSQNLSTVSSQIGQLEKSMSPDLKRLHQIRFFYLTEDSKPISTNPLSEAIESLNNLPVVELKKTQKLRSIQSSLNSLSDNLKNKLSESEEAMPEGGKTAEEYYPTSINVTKRNENIGGKKTLMVITDKKFENESLNSTEESLISIYSENLLLMGSREKITEAINQRTAATPNGSNLRTRGMLGKTPNSLVSFAVDLENVDLSDTSELLEGQTNVWEIYGAVTSVSREVSLSISVDKTDIPLKLPPKASGETSSRNKLKIPIVEDSSAAADLFKLLVKSVIGAEGKFTLKFDKKKIAKLVKETPKLLGDVLNTDVRQNSLKTVSR